MLLLRQESTKNEFKLQEKKTILVRTISQAKQRPSVIALTTTI